MKKSLSSIEIACIVKELQILVGGKIDKVFQPVKEVLILQLHVPNLGKKYLQVKSGKLLHLVESKDSTDRPPGFCMFLRKHLANSRIRSVTQIGSERIVKIELETKDSKYELVFELFSTGNFILLKDNKILSAIEYKKWKSRVIKPNEEYVYPESKYNFFKIKDTDLITMFEETELESVVKSLALDMAIGGVYAEELCLRAGIDKDAIPKKFKKIQELFAEIKKMRKLNIKAFVIDDFKDVVPFDMIKYEKSEKVPYKTYNDALDKLAGLQKETIKKEVGTKKSKELLRLKKMIDSQLENIEKLGNDEKVNREKADIIYSHYQEIQDIITQINKALKKMDFKEIKKKLKGHKIVKEVNAKDKSILVEMDNQ